VVQVVVVGSAVDVVDVVEAEVVLSLHPNQPGYMCQRKMDGLGIGLTVLQLLVVVVEG
jgi:hypothetical protein